MFSAAAVSKVYSDDVEAGMKALLRGCLHVVGASGTFDSMPDDDGRMLVSCSLPAAMSEHPDARGHFKQTLLVTFGSETKSPWPGIGSDGLRMTVAKQRVGLKRFAGELLASSRQENPSLFEFVGSAVRLSFFSHRISRSVLELDDHVGIQI